MRLNVCTVQRQRRQRGRRRGGEIKRHYSVRERTRLLQAKWRLIPRIFGLPLGSIQLLPGTDNLRGSWGKHLWRRQMNIHYGSHWQTVHILTTQRTHHWASIQNSQDNTNTRFSEDRNFYIQSSQIWRDSNVTLEGLQNNSRIGTICWKERASTCKHLNSDNAKSSHMVQIYERQRFKCPSTLLVARVDGWKSVTIQLELSFKV